MHGLRPLPESVSSGQLELFRHLWFGFYAWASLRAGATKLLPLPRKARSEQTSCVCV